MPIFHEFPYGNMHDQNYDWILKVVKEMLDKYQDIDTHVAEALAQIEAAKTGSLEDMQTALENALAEINEAIENIGSAETNALTHINNARSNALIAITTEKTQAVSAIDSQKTDALDAIAIDKADAQSAIATDKADAQSAITTDKQAAQNAIAADQATAQAAISTDQTAALLAIQTALSAAISALNNEQTTATYAIQSLYNTLPSDSQEIIGLLQIIMGMLNSNYSTSFPWLQCYFSGSDGIVRVNDNTYLSIDETRTTGCANRRMIFSTAPGYHLYELSYWNYNQNPPPTEHRNYITFPANTTYYDFTFPAYTVCFSLTVRKDDLSTITDADVAGNINIETLMNAVNVPSMIAFEESDLTADIAHIVGTPSEYFMYNGALYRALEDIPQYGTIIITGATANCEETTVSKEINEKVKKLKSDFTRGSGCIPINFTTDGYIDNTTGEITSTQNHITSEFIKVSEGDKLWANPRIGTSAFSVGMYANTSSFADLTKSIIGSGYASFITITIPSGIEYIRFSILKASVDDFSVYTNSGLFKFAIAEGYELALPLTISAGYVSSSTGQIITNDAYRYTNMIDVQAGETYKYSASGSVNVFEVAMYSNDYDKADENVSILGSNYENYKYFTVPNEITKIRLCSRTDNPTLQLLKVAFSTPNLTRESGLHKNKLLKIETEITAVNNKLSGVISDSNLLLTKRKASISFVFDDGDAKDADIKAIFDAHSKKCGFAVYAPIDNRYVNYFNDGYEILAHANAPVSSPTEETERTQMLSAYNAVVTAIGECKGWVTPSSALDEQFRPLVYDYYNYGYTIYKGNISNPSDACMNKTLASYGLWRSSLQALTLAEQKAIVDYAVSNNLMVCFYGHASGLDGSDNLTTNNLNELLTYCDTKGIDVELPYNSVKKFFAFRHNEDFIS